MQLNSQIIYEIASQVFWREAMVHGVMQTHGDVVETCGRCLIESPFLGNVLRELGVSDLDERTQELVLTSAADEAYKFSRDEQNMNGIIYAEDALQGRSPSAKGIDAGSLGPVPKNIDVSGARIPSAGTLCLRHPLPAVVFASAPPTSAFIRVESTSRALRVEWPMFMMIQAVREAGNGLYAYQGVFHIPVSSSGQGDLWGQVIQNSVRFMGGAVFQSGVGVTEIRLPG